MIPAILSSNCSDSMESIFKLRTFEERDKALIDIWVGENINKRFITPKIMERIQSYKTIRIKDLYNTMQ